MEMLACASASIVRNAIINVAVLIGYSILGSVTSAGQMAIENQNSLLRQAQDQATSRISDPSYRLVVQHGQEDVVYAAAISRDNKLVATGYQNGTARIWDKETGAELQRLTGHLRHINAATFSWDGKFVLTGSGDGTMRLWDVSNGSEVKRFGELGDPQALMGRGANAVALSHDGLWAWGADIESQTVWKWELATQKQIKSFSLNTCGVRGVAFSGVSGVAFSSDARWVVTGCYDGRVQLWNAETGQVVQRFVGHAKQVFHVAVSADGHWVVTGSLDQTVRLWDGKTGNLIRKYSSQGDIKTDGGLGSNVLPPLVTSVAVSEDGQWIVAGLADNCSKVWEQASEQLLYTFVNASSVEHGGGFVRTVQFSQDGTLILAGSDRGHLWDRAKQTVSQVYAGRTIGASSMAMSAQAHLLVIGGENGSTFIWDLNRGREVLRLNGHEKPVRGVAISNDNHLVVTGSVDKTVRIWDRIAGKERYRLDHRDEVTSVAISPNGKRIVSGCRDNIARLWDSDSGTEIFQFDKHTNSVETVAFSPDGRGVLTGSWDGSVKLWDAATGQLQNTFQANGLTGIYSVAVSQDGKWIAAGFLRGQVVVFDRHTGSEVSRHIEHRGVVAGIAFSSSGDLVVTGSWDGTVHVWDRSTGSIKHILRESIGVISAVMITSDDRWIFSASASGVTRIWNVTTGKFWGQLVNLEDARWAVVGRDGRFDTDNFETMKGLHWIVPDDPLHALPPEIFMRDFYEPRLLPRVLAREKFRDLPRLDQLNRAQPKVEIKDVRVEEQQAGLVAVTVEVASNTVNVSREGKPVVRKGKPVVMQSGAFDLRLFRNGQLVGQYPEPKAEQTFVDQTQEQERVQWRQLHHIDLDPQTGKKTVTFHDIRLPRKAGLTEVEFSAYAFNGDRVKSATAQRTIDLPKDLIPRQGRAYVVTIGVNGFQGNAMSPLTFAANDAKRLSTELSSRLKIVQDPDTGNPVFGETNVVSVALVTEVGTGEQAGQFTVNLATKSRIKAVIDTLTGKPVDPAWLKNITNADQLQRAQPEDLVVIAFSTHGDTDGRGQFYLMPSDLGMSTKQTDLRQHAISSEELSTWLRTLDAGELVMIVDACHSAATVESHEFKPGPMGSRGLGQLAYDKGMRILAASQRDQAALETENTQQGLLSYALVQEGLQDAAADLQPKDGRIQLAEWLRYGVERVPGLYQDYREGKLTARTAIPLDEPEGKNFISIQQPALFDFARGRDLPLMIGVGR